MRIKLVVAAILITFMPGCFMVTFGAIGAVTDSNDSPKPAVVQAPAYEGPPGSFRRARPAKATKAKEDTGMSGAGKGALLGLVVDAVLVGLTIHALSQIDNECGLYGCGDSY